MRPYKSEYGENLVNTRGHVIENTLMINHTKICTMYVVIKSAFVPEHTRIWTVRVFFSKYPYGLGMFLLWNLMNK